MKRKAEMKSYLNSKIDKFAMEPSYYKILADEGRIKELALILGIDDKDVIEIRNKVIQVKKE